MLSPSYPALLPAVSSTAQVSLLSCISASFAVAASLDAQDVGLECSRPNKNTPILSSTTFNTHQSTGTNSYLFIHVVCLQLSKTEA